jgi:hypothetical protein
MKLIFYPKNLLFSLLFLLGFFFTMSHSFDFSKKTTDRIIRSDAEGYYMYLPAVFIYGGFVDIPIQTEEEFRHYPGGDNKFFTKYPCGVAIMQLPFFLVAHWMAIIYEQPVTGYSDYYVYGVLAAALFYAFIGLFFLKKALEKHFSLPVVSVALVSLFLGTNAFYYTVREPAMSHIYSFCLFAVFIYLTPGFYEKPKWRKFVLMGALSGLIVLIRPTNIIILLFLLFYGIASVESLRRRVQFYLRNAGSVFLAALCAFIVFIPQFLYWKYISGNYIMYSYEGEGFIYWASPQIGKVLFNIKNGWLLHTPMAVLPVAGLLMGVRKDMYHSRVILLILLLALYIFSSWWCWWFGGAFGYRSFVEYMALLAFPLAYLTSVVFKQPVVFRAVFLLLIAVLIYYNLGLTAHYVGPHFTEESLREALQEIFLLN